MPLSATLKRMLVKNQRMEIRARIDRSNDHHIPWKDNRARRTRKLTTLLHQEPENGQQRADCSGASEKSLALRCKLRA